MTTSHRRPARKIATRRCSVCTLIEQSTQIHPGLSLILQMAIAKKMQDQFENPWVRTTAFILDWCYYMRFKKRDTTLLLPPEMIVSLLLKLSLILKKTQSIDFVLFLTMDLRKDHFLLKISMIFMMKSWPRPTVKLILPLNMTIISENSTQLT